MSDGKSSLAWKFTKAAGKLAIIGGLSFMFGVAVSGLFDYHLWHDIPELKPVIKDTAWIKDALRADIFFGYSFVDGVTGFFDLFSGFSDGDVTISSEQATETLKRGISQSAQPDF